VYLSHRKYTIKQKGFKHQKKSKTFPGFLAFINSTEQQIPRPIDKNRRKKYYSGKKKRHTIKNQLMVNSHVNGMLYLLVK
jgi:hypothetical protein